MLAPLVGFLQRSGARAEPFLSRAGIPVELIEVGGWIGKRQAYDFIFDVVRRTGCPEAVYDAYLDFDISHLGPIATAMAACKTVKESLEVGLRLGGTAYEGNEYFLRTGGDTSWICYREPHVASAGQTFINDMTLTVYSHLIRALVNEDWHPEWLLIRNETNQRHRGVGYFEQCEVASHPNLTALAFPTEFLSRRLPNSLGVESPSQPWQFGPEGSAPTVERLHRLLTSCLPSGELPTLGEVAGRVDVSQATLKRRLAEAGTTYQRLLDRIRFDSACELLLDADVPLGEIARRLGYSGTNNFIRSFRRMTGTTPELYRRKSRGGNAEAE
ncbi:AraC family transcriptional regulator [Rosistilla oblonga]|uniref:AraC family transcriptional regulator n=1 Tax=Rosistilla oblonga TaxID=2527990 RepID=UPI0018D1F89A|nr:AraC family transcriptional regulator [Rosistilla oblonga]